MSARCWPMQAGSYQISSGFGPRWGTQHNGLDFAAPLGTPIYAVADGVVVEGSDRRANTVDGFGNWVWLDHQVTHGVDTIYGHIRHADIKVWAGDRVKAGQLIALVGNEGQSTGPHLHFDVWGKPGRIGGRAQDPAAWLAGAGSPVAAAPAPVAPKPVPAPIPSPGGTPLKPDYREIIRFGPSSSSRNGARVSNFLLHTEEGNASAEGLAAFCNNPGNGASYHYVVRDGIVVCINDTDRASWSVLNANPYTINLVFAGSKAGWSREDWLRREGDIRIAAWLAIQDAKKYGFSIEVNPRPYPLGRRDGFSDHGYVTRVLRIGNHTDTGDRFPWDRFATFVDEILRGVVAPPPVVVVNRIDEMAAAAAWLGKRLTGEETCPDGVGKFAHFENGSIYWTPTTDARPIPKFLLESYETYKWETGPLGYPIAYHTSLTDADGKWAADVQAFEKGVLYRRVGSPLGFFVTGRIGARWAREGYEKSAYGYPTSNEIHLGDGTVIQNFEHGRIAWNPDGTLGLKLDVGVEQIVQQVH